VGPGDELCGSYKLGDAIKEPVSNLVFFYDDEGVKGIRVATALKVGNFGQTDLAKKVNFAFTAESPLIGVYGFGREAGINGISVIKYELESDCYKGLQAKVDSFSQVKDVEKSDEGEKSAIDILTVGIYTSAGFLSILLIFCCVLMIEKMRKNRKRITEIVEL